MKHFATMTIRAKANGHEIQDSVVFAAKVEGNGTHLASYDDRGLLIALHYLDCQTVTIQ